MIFKFKQISFKVFIFLLLFASSANILNAQQRVKKVVMQAFWWDYYNNNYRFKWADYLTELAPRLKAAGVDAIWIPPNYKNDGPGSVGYGPFDQYDLGDKNQKGDASNDTLKTRSGTKDELLRMMAVMHANGIDVIQDIVLNHTTGAGNRGSGGGRDYTAASAPYKDQGTAYNGQIIGGSDYYKNFRYSCYATPFLDTSAADYFTRKGRWSKNIMNFYPNANNNYVNTSEISTAYFGPDIAYEANSIGQSTNIPTSGSVTIKGITKSYYNPVQATNYMAQSAKDWIVWYKKQTGADGFRWDAVKHYGYSVQSDLTYALKYQSGFANGGNNMFNVGEYVGQPSEVDYYVSQLIKTGTPIESGIANEQLSGGFDFGLRAYASSGSIYSMVLGQGNFDMQSIPGAQQSTRYFDYPNGTRVYKTVPFVNSHDTYRPILTANGNFSQSLGNAAGWNTGNELGGNGNHIDPREPRFAAANAVIAAVDGNPCFYIEDVFDYFTLNKRWTHIPSNVDSLPIRKDVVNIMLCHQKLGFKDGDYGVPTAQTGVNAPAYISGSSGDHIVFERTGKALIGVSDAYSSASNNTADQQVWVTCNTAWTPGTVLYDYSGAHGVSGTTIQSDRRVLIKTAPCGHNITGVYGHGYSIWAPYPNGTPTTVADLWNYIATYNQPRAITTQQEWEMADDLGDSHCASLGQGGQLPANSTNQRVAGKIFVQSGTNVAYYLTPSIDNTNLSISLWDLDGNKLSEATGNSSAASPISGSFSAAYTGWITIKVRHAVATQAAQKVWANVTYTAPTVIDTRATANAATTRVSIWTGNKGTTDITDCGNWEEGLVPTNSSTVIVPSFANPAPVFPNGIAGRVIATTTTAGTYKNVYNTVMNLTGTTPINSTSTGDYSYTNLVPKSYTIKPTKLNDLNKSSGINGLDLFALQNHLLNKTLLNTPYKIIAADVDGSKSVGGLDLFYLKKFLLAAITTFPNNRLWAFVDSAYQFPNSANPFPFKDSIVVTPDISNIKSNQTFIGVKLGDLTLDWSAAAARGIATKPVEFVYHVISTKEKSNQPDFSGTNHRNDEPIKIPVTVNNFKDLVEMQYTLHFNNKDYEFAGIENNALGIEFNDKEASKNGLVSFLWIDKNGEEKTLEDGTEVFTLVFHPTINHKQSSELQLAINSSMTNIEAWDKDYQQHNIILTKQIKNSEQGIVGNEFWSVSPNPTSGDIKVAMVCKAAKTIVFELSNAEGKTITQQSFEAIRGNNTININLKKNTHLPTGIYFLKAVGLDGENVKKIIVQ